jgi:hypothetical protein
MSPSLPLILDSPLIICNHKVQYYVLTKQRCLTTTLHRASRRMRRTRVGRTRRGAGATIGHCAATAGASP